MNLLFTGKSNGKEMDRQYCFYYLASLSSAQLHNAKFTAKPGTRQRRDHEGKWIPMWAQGRNVVPCSYCANKVQDKTNYAAHQRML